jgi:hypothetical protein
VFFFGQGPGLRLALADNHSLTIEGAAMLKQGDGSTRRRPLISNTSTLVLSIFLIAAAAIELAGDEVGVYVLACGLTGLLGYLGLEAANERRLRKALADREEDAFRRLNKHLTTPIAPVPLNFDRDPLGDLFRSTPGSASGSGASSRSTPDRPQAG